MPVHNPIIYIEYDRIIDKTTDSPNVFIGEAKIGSAKGDTVWRIKKLTIDGDDVIIGWADSVQTFTKEWDERDSYTYSQTST